MRQESEGSYCESSIKACSALLAILEEPVG